MFNALVVGVLALSSMTGQPSLVLTDDPPDGSVTVQLATLNGSGCPAGSTALALDPGNTFFTVTYNKFVAQVGVGARPMDFRSNCQIFIQVHIPQGFTFAIAKTDYRGFASLQAGAWGQERANYYFQGMSQTVYAAHRLDGPMVNDWQTTDEVGIAALVWRRCGDTRALTINQELTVYGGTSDTGTTTSFLNMDSTDVDFSTVYNFAWKRC